MITYEFRCVYGHITEHEMSIENDCQEVECDACGEEAHKIISRNPNRPTGLPTEIHHKDGGDYTSSGPMDMGTLD